MLANKGPQINPWHSTNVLTVNAFSLYISNKETLDRITYVFPSVSSTYRRLLGCYYSCVALLAVSAAVS